MSSLSLSMWWSALFSASLISIVPNVLLLFVPSSMTASTNSSIETKKRIQFYLSLGQALAAGGLLGDVLFHTNHQHDHQHSHEEEHHHHDEEDEDLAQQICMAIGFSIFFLLDITIRSFSSEDENNHYNHSHSHSHHNHQISSSSNDKKNNNNTTISSIISLFLSSPFLLLNVTADALHNFTDGIAIGVSYAASSHTSTFAWTTTLCILLHEVPHQVGDYCLLAQSGRLKSWDIILIQCVTATLALLGTICGIGMTLLANHYFVSPATTSDNNQSCLAFSYWYSHLASNIHPLHMVAGGFLYVATVCLLPDILATTPYTTGMEITTEQQNGETNHQQSNGNGHHHPNGARSQQQPNGSVTTTMRKSNRKWLMFQLRLIQFMFFIIGMTLLYLVTFLEEEDDHHHHHHHDVVEQELDEKVHSTAVFDELYI